MPFSFDKSLLDNVDVGIVVYDKDGWVQFVNATHLKFSYYTYEDFQRFNTYDIYHSKVSNICLFDKAVKTKRPATAIQHTYHGRDDSSYDKLVTAIPILDEFGNIANVVSTFVDLNDFHAKYSAAQQESNITYDMSPSKKYQAQVIYGSGEMQRLLDTAKVIAATDVPVLITGESGTGKEVLANFIHRHSHRADRPMVEINCAALPENLLEAELFGYEKGAFTGALNTGKPGMVEEANGGPLFLDEINSLPLALQGKLLRVLESHKSKRLGAVSEREIDFRLLAATNQDLKTCVEKGSFRADLYYRLNVIPLEIPPLRNRREDIIPLALFFLDHFCKKYGRTKVFTKGVFNQMMCYDWPGNVRELKNVVERLLITSSVGTMEIRQVPENLLGEGSVPPPPPEVYPADWESIYQYDPEDFSLKKYMNFCEKQVVAAALKRCGSSYKAAELLKTDQSTIIRKRQKYGIS